MGIATRIWGLIIVAYIFIISGMIMNGNLIWTDKLQQSEATKKSHYFQYFLALKFSKDIKFYFFWFHKKS